MIYLKLICFIILFIAFIFIILNIIEGKIRTKANEKILWKMENMDKIIEIDKAVTRTGGIAHDRKGNYSEIQKKNDRKAQ